MAQLSWITDAIWQVALALPPPSPPPPPPTPIPDDPPPRLGTLTRPPLPTLTPTLTLASLFWQDTTPPSEAEAEAEAGAEVHSKLVAPGLAWLGGWLESAHVAYLFWSGLSLGVIGFLSLGMVR